MPGNSVDSADTPCLRARHALWTAVLLGMMLMPFLRIVLPQVSPTLWPAATAEVQSGVSVLAGATGKQADARSAKGRGASLPGTARQNLPARWPVLILVLYAGVALVLGARTATACFFARRLVRRSRQIRCERLLTLARPLLSPWGIAPRIYQSNLVNVPVTVGFLRPTIILPED
jgi:hypothetical protein